MGSFDARTSKLLTAAVVGGIAALALLTGCGASTTPVPAPTEPAPTKSDPFYKENIFFAGVTKATISKPDQALVLTNPLLETQDGQKFSIDGAFGQVVSYGADQKPMTAYNFLWSSNAPEAYQEQQCFWEAKDLTRPKGAPSDCGVIYVPARMSLQQIRYALYPDEAKLVIGWNGDWNQKGLVTKDSVQPVENYNYQSRTDTQCSGAEINYYGRVMKVDPKNTQGGQKTCTTDAMEKLCTKSGWLPTGNKCDPSDPNFLSKGFAIAESSSQPEKKTKSVINFQVVNSEILKDVKNWVSVVDQNVDVRNKTIKDKNLIIYYQHISNGVSPIVIESLEEESGQLYLERQGGETFKLNEYADKGISGLAMLQPENRQGRSISGTGTVDFSKQNLLVAISVGTERKLIGIRFQNGEWQVVTDLESK